MEKENNTELSNGNLIEIGRISYNSEGNTSGEGTLYIKHTFGFYNILLKTTSGFHVVVAGKRVKCGKTYNAFFRIPYSEYYLNLPDNLIDVISSKQQSASL